MNPEDYIILLEDNLEEDMRGEYGKDLLYVSYEYLMLPLNMVGEKLTDMICCRNERKTSMYQLRLKSINDDKMQLVFDSYILRNENFTLSEKEPYRRGVRGYRGKYHYLTFSLHKKEGFKMPKDLSEYKNI